MDHNRWQQVIQIFDAVVDQPIESRRSLLDSLCGGEMELRQEVDSMLAAHDGDPAFLERAPGNVAGLSFSAADDEHPDWIGPYRVLHPLDVGGMGEIYLAERVVEGVHQSVAIKRVPRGLLTPAVLRRFLRERRILATLDHPNICRLIDTGVTESQQPYMVMPFLEGALPITVYCDTRTLSLAERIMLFEKVCRAVHYAHQRLIVHADLKPANILVTPQGEPMLLDFGIARLLGPSTDQAHTTLMAGGTPRPLTPDYASPEQLMGEVPHTTSDVYALGVILFELLAGCRPYSADPTDPRATVEYIASTVMRPSTRRADTTAASRKQRAALKGDLDNITAKALSSDPNQRYSASSALADDLQRWRMGQPVLAHAPSVSYQIAKFVGRHRVAASLTAAALVALISFAVVVSVLALRISEQATQLRVERDRAETVVQFMSDLFNTTNPMVAEGSAPTARQMLDRGLELSNALDPEAREAALTVIGGALAGLGDYGAARDALDRAGDPDAAPTSLAAATLLRERAALEYREDHLDLADPLAQQAYDLAASLLPADDKRIVPFLNTLGITAADSGRAEQAEALLTRAIALRRQEPGYARHQAYADAARSLADLFHTLGRLDEAEPLYEEAVASYIASSGPDFSVTAITLNNQSAMRRKQGRIAEALDGYLHARDIAERAFGPEHPFVGVVHNNIGRLQLRLGQIDAARDTYARAVVINRAALPPGHPTLARSQGGLGEALWLLNEPASAIPPLQQALAIFTDSGRGQSTEALDVQRLLGQAQWRNGAVDAGLATLAAGLRTAWDTLPEDDATRQRYREALQSLSLTPEALLTGQAADGT